jgi:dienelactone hydrolase
MRALLGPSLGFVLFAAFLGCGLDEQLSPLPGDGSGGAGGSGGFASTSAASGGGGEEEPPVPPSEPVSLAVPEWRVAKVKDAAEDPVRAAIEAGTFDLPPEGDYLGLSWKTVVPGPAGELEGGSFDLVYAVARVPLGAHQKAFARADTVATLYANNASRHPGDLYGTRALRSPIGMDAGDNLVVVRALGRGATPEIELFSTTSEVVWNPGDVTRPELVVGSSEEQWLGIATLVLVPHALSSVTAEVLEGDNLEGTQVDYPSLSPRGVTQLSFRLLPKAPWSSAGATVPVKLRLTSPDLDWPYETTVDVSTVDAGARFRRTRRSNVDHSTQFDAVLPPQTVSPGSQYGLILSLHGAGVDALGQAASYSAKDWAYLVAPTNRRPYGFDWEEWGRLDAIEAYDHALATLPVDPTRTHLTGHSMGGHGTYHVGVHFAGRFGVIAPSAGWRDFASYGGGAQPTGTIGRARAASNTLDYVDNVAANTLYIIHGAKDTTVPVSQAKTMFATLGTFLPPEQLTYYEDPNGRHWWDNDGAEEGADCVDWEPMISVMAATTRELSPKDFRFTTPAPWVSPTRSFVTLRSAADPLQDLHVESTSAGDTLTLTTSNVRSMVLDGDALGSLGVATVLVDGVSHAVTPGPIPVGPQTGKTATQSGPLNQVYQHPFCFVYDDDGPVAYRDYAGYLTSWWSKIGNGHACALPLSQLPPGLGAAYDLIYLGVAQDKLEGAGALPIDFDATGFTAGTTTLADAALAFVFPVGERLHAAYFATPGKEYLLFRYMPFTSRSGMPDFLFWGDDGVLASGFFDADWQVDPAFSEGL